MAPDRCERRGTGDGTLWRVVEGQTEADDGLKHSDVTKQMRERASDLVDGC
jgi:hypothetical protein